MADFPNIEPDSEEIALIANNQVYNSPLTGQAQTASLTGAKWQCTPTFSNRNGKEARDLRAFLFDQEGVSGRFNYYPASVDNIGTHAGGGVVDGAGQTGKSLLTKGWDADQPLLFSAGDYLTVNGEMKMVTADVAVGQDYIEYDDTNYMPSPFDTDGWQGANDSDVSYTKILESNPSGANHVGQFEYIGPGTPPICQSLNNSISIGDKSYISILVKGVTGTELGLRIAFQENVITFSNVRVNVQNGASSVSGGISSVFVTDLDDEWKLIQVENTSENEVLSDFDVYVQFYKIGTNGSQIGFPSVGDKIKCQAAFFGKTNDWPAKLRANATIPITPAIRVSPSDENAIEVENPYFPARLDTDDMSRLQVSAPVIYNTTLSIVEDF